jgi:pimeloyl-ACP methyl ester carboxylesterase
VTNGTFGSAQGRRSSARAVVLVALLASGCADRLLLEPRRDVLQCDATRRSIDVDGGELEIWTIRTRPLEDDASHFFVLFFGGVGDRAEEEAILASETWRDSSAEIWAVNYPGYGGSSGPAALKRIPPAALAAYDELRKHAAGRPILISGSSLGSAVALYVAAQRPAAGAVLRNPPPLRSLILGRYGWWNLWIGAGIVALQVPSELDSIENARKVRVPALFLLASDDDVVPPSYARDVVDAYAGPFHIVDFKGGHDAPVEPAWSAELRQGLRWLAGASGIVPTPEATVR